MATKTKKKVKTNTKQKQKQTQKQNVVVNINTEKKKSTKKKQSKNQSSTNRPLRPTAETAYNRVITQSQPMLIQQIPNNNDLIGAIHQLSSKFQQPSVPVQYNPDLLERTIKSVQELNDAIYNSDRETSQIPKEKLKTRVIDKPRKESEPYVIKPDTVYNIPYDNGAGVFGGIEARERGNDKKSVFDGAIIPYTPKKENTPEKKSGYLSKLFSSTKKKLGMETVEPDKIEISSSLVSKQGAKTNKEPQFRKTEKGKLQVLNPATNRYIDAFGSQANRLGLGLPKPPSEF